MVLQRSVENTFVTMMRSTILTLCRESLPHQNALNVDGLIGVTMDNQDVVLINLKDILVKGSRLPDPSATMSHPSPQTIGAAPGLAAEEVPWLPRKRAAEPDTEQGQAKKKRNKRKKKTKAEMEADKELMGNKDQQEPEKDSSAAGEFICEVCTSVFTLKNSLDNHRNGKHKIPWQCDDCPFNSMQKKDLHTHRKDIHNVKLKRSQEKRRKKSKDKEDNAEDDVDVWSGDEEAEDYLLMDEYNEEGKDKDHQMEKSGQNADGKENTMMKVEEKGADISSNEKTHVESGAVQEQMGVKPEVVNQPPGGGGAYQGDGMPLSGLRGMNAALIPLTGTGAVNTGQNPTSS